MHKISFTLASLLFLGPSLFATEIHWVNPSGGEWSNPKNWSGGVVPTMTDRAVIDAKGTYTIDVKGWAEAEVIDLGKGATLVVGPEGGVKIERDLFVRSGAATRSSGNFAGPGSVKLEGTFDWEGGRIGCWGNLIVRPGGLLRLTGEKLYLETTLQNDGRIEWVSRGFLDVIQGNTLNNKGTLELRNESAIIESYPGRSKVFNSGTIIKTGTGRSIIDVTFDNSGTIVAEQSTIALYLGAGSGGVFRAKKGAMIEFMGSRALDSSSSVEGDGTVRFRAGAIVIGGKYSEDVVSIVSGGAVVFMAKSTLIGELTIENGAAVSGSGTFTVTRRFDFAEGRISGEGGTLIASTAAARISKTASLDGRKLEIEGSCVVEPGARFLMMNGAVVENRGTLELKGDGSVAVQFGAAKIDNRGLLRKSGDGVAACTPRVINSGRIVVEAGRLILENGLEETGGRTELAGGTIDVR